jgi:hypothetical protein
VTGRRLYRRRATKMHSAPAAESYPLEDLATGVLVETAMRTLTVSI